jgi:hypothetical protein
MRPVKRSVNGPCCLAKGRGSSMRPVKRVPLGAAAGVFTVAGSQAADLPTNAQPVEYVRAPGA